MCLSDPLGYCSCQHNVKGDSWNRYQGTSIRILGKIKTHRVRGAAKAVLRGKFVAVNASIEKEGISC